MAVVLGLPRAAVPPPPPTACDGPLRTMGRLLHACSTGWTPQGVEAPEVDMLPLPPLGAAGERRPLAFADLADGPYYLVARQLGAEDLMRADAVCRLTHELNRSSGGPWWDLGRRRLLGVELDGDSLFDPSGDERRPEVEGCRKTLRMDWKCRYMRFLAEARMFRAPFYHSEITSVLQADEIAFTRCRLRTDLLEASCDFGVYLEFEVFENPDNASLALVDFEAGGSSSLTFSPDTGAVIRERKVREAPRKVEGSYIQPLPSLNSGRGFEGSMGLYLKGGRLAFFRRHVEHGTSDEDQVITGPWETTGFVTDLSWAEGRRLTPCIAFRDVGDYHLRLARVGAEPPIVVSQNKLAFEDSLWRSLDWDAGEQESLES